MACSTLETSPGAIGFVQGGPPSCLSMVSPVLIIVAVVSADVVCVLMTVNENGLRTAKD